MGPLQGREPASGSLCCASMLLPITGGATSPPTPSSAWRTKTSSSSTRETHISLGVPNTNIVLLAPRRVQHPTRTTDFFLATPFSGSFCLSPKSEVRAYFICMRGTARTGVAYELMPNYGEPEFPSQYWNATHLATLPTVSREACERCYPLEHPRQEIGPHERGPPGAPRLNHVNNANVRVDEVPPSCFSVRSPDTG